MSTKPTPVDEADLHARLATLTLEQKVELLTGRDFWALNDAPVAGLRRMVLSDGPAGVRGERWDERSPSANVPTPTALAATWDEALVGRIGHLLASESRAKGVDVLLAPTVNLHRSPYGGRHFECLSEDPFLTGRIGTAYVQGVQSGGVAATVKHFVGNDSETDRFTVDARIDERTLHELYLAPFETIVADGVWAVMSAYNQVNGTTMTESALQRDVLKGEWGFDGMVMSDWYAARTLAAAGEELLDLVMPGPTGPWGAALVAAVEDGSIPESSVDDKVLRLLRLAARVGALSGVAAAVPAVTPWTHDQIAAELRSAAAAGFVLARNEGGVLPLADSVRSVAVIGPNAAAGRTLGGGSATVFPYYTVSPLDGILAAADDRLTVTHSVGVRSSDRLAPTTSDQLLLPDDSGPGAVVRFLDADGAELGSEVRLGSAYTWLGLVNDDLAVPDVATVEVATRLVVSESGSYLVGAAGVGAFRLTVGGDVTVDEQVALPDGADAVEAMMTPPQRSTSIAFRAGEPIDVLLSFTPPASVGFGGAMAILSFQLVLGAELDEDAEFERAVALAAEADVAVVVVGTTAEVESEGFDRTSLALPGRQDELVLRVAAVNPRTVVVVNSGAPVLLPWADKVDAILLAWFPGQEFGNALADVLLGTSEPGGRLPTTWPARGDGLPAVTPTDGTLTYDEGLFIGYRHYDRAGLEPLFPFGHGLGYTTFAFEEAEAEPTDAGAVLSVAVRNTGERPGRTVVQVYASRPDSAIERVQRWLVGFAALELGPDEQGTARITLPERVFQHWDTTASAWALEPGTYNLQIGPSMASTELTAEVKLA